MTQFPDQLAERVVWNRIAQLLINEDYRNGLFKIPIHLALGHEALAVALDAAMLSEDRVVLTHRNIAYNLARAKDFTALRDEYLQKPGGLAQGKLGSMNLANRGKGIPYTSSILGNDFAVGAGVALALKQSGRGVAFALGGDGSLEEGIFYETLVFAKSQTLPLVVLIENNEWSMATHITERRQPIDLTSLAQAVGASYVALTGNNVEVYKKVLTDARALAQSKGPVLLEAAVHTLGDWVKQEEKGPRLINYHAGPAPEVTFDGIAATIVEDATDPLFVLKNEKGEAWLAEEITKSYTALAKEIV